MNSRDSFIKEFRGETLGQISDQSSAEEVFQNFNATKHRYGL